VQALEAEAAEAPPAPPPHPRSGEWRWEHARAEQRRRKSKPADVDGTGAVDEMLPLSTPPAPLQPPPPPMTTTTMTSQPVDVNKAGDVEHLTPPTPPPLPPVDVHNAGAGAVKHMFWAAVAEAAATSTVEREDVPEVPGAFLLRGVLGRSRCAALAAAVETLQPTQMSEGATDAGEHETALGSKAGPRR